jgi:hypothetical protein
MSTVTRTLDDLVKSPTDHFRSPGEVLTDRTLNKDGKRRVLEAWVKDAQLMSKADDENMSGGEPARLREAKLALGQLDMLPSQDP